MTVALLGRDAGGQNTFAPIQSNIGFRITLVANTAASLTVPKSQNTNSPYLLCVISPASAQELWVSNYETAVLPSSGSFVACQSEMNPPARMVKQGSTISIISPLAIDVGISFYEPQGPY